jgi:hypothetical protein
VGRNRRIKELQAAGRALQAMQDAHMLVWPTRHGVMECVLLESTVEHVCDRIAFVRAAAHVGIPME